MPKPPLPSSQQLIDRLLNAMGQRGAFRVKESTSKKAGRDEPVPHAWQQLVGDLCKALRVPTTLASQLQLQSALRGYDLEVSRLSGHNLAWTDRMPALIRVLAPWVGLRLGALAALADRDPWGVAPRFPELGDWLQEPLSARSMARAVDGVLRLLPAWRAGGTDARLEILGKAGVSKRTWEDWSSPTKTVLPHPSKLKRLTERLPPEAQERAMYLLRLARVALSIRQWVEAQVGRQGAQDLERVLAAWARSTRAALATPTLQRELLQAYAEALSLPEGAALFEQMGALLQPVGPALNQGQAAAWLRQQDQLPTTVLAGQALLPLPHLMLSVAPSVVPDPSLRTLLDEPWQAVQAYWNRMAVLRALAEGQLPHGPGGPKAASPDLRDRAAQTLLHERRVIASRPEPAHWPETVAVLLQALGEAGIPTDGAEVEALMRHGLVARHLPVSLEPDLTDAVVRQNPHLAARRMLRLARLGSHAEALALYTTVRDSPFRVTSDSMDAARALTVIAHTTLDPLRGGRTDLRTLSDALSSAQWKELLEGRLLGFDRAGEIAHALYRQGCVLLRGPTDRVAEGVQHALLFPLAVRVDGLAAVLAQEPEPTWPRASLHAERVRALLDTGHEDGDLWAVWSAWCRLQREPVPALDTRAEHRGADGLLTAMLDQFEGDGLL